MKKIIEILIELFNPVKIFLALIIVVSLLFFVPNATQNQAPTAKSILKEYASQPELSLAIPSVGADCSNQCKIRVCLDWDPNPCGPNPWDIGCCVEWGTECDPECEAEEEPPPPSYTAPDVSASLTCGTMGNNGWCRNNGSVVITGSDPQGFSMSISGTVTINGSGTPFTCASPCNLNMVPGDASVSYQATAATSGLSSATKNIAYKFDNATPVLTPSITGTSGANSWFVSNVSVSATASDAVSGLSGQAQVSFDGGATWGNMPVSIGEGIYSILFRVTDLAGNEQNISRSVSIDITLPEVELVYTGTTGTNGWYVSNVVATTNASDAFSGLDRSEVRVNGGSWSPSLTLADGSYVLDGNAVDIAGNSRTVSGSLYVDTVPPVSTITSHANNQVVLDTVTLSGQSIDVTSGLQYAEISFDGGTSWHITDVSSNTWSYTLDTSTFPNGPYLVKVRGVDMAGNTESVLTQLILLFDNVPPDVSITDSWLIWQKGEYKVSPNYFPIQDVIVTISDSQGRWKDRVIEYNPSLSSSFVEWDRRFPGDILAPAGEDYPVSVTACDIHDQCASDRGFIRIRVSSPASTTTPSPMPTMTLTLTATPTVIPTTQAGNTPQPTPTIQPVIIPPVMVEPVKPVAARTPFPLFKTMAVVFFISLMWAVASASLMDPRAGAIYRIAETVSKYTNRN